MKKLIRKWLGLKDTHTVYQMCLKRKFKKDVKKELELQKKLVKLAKKYPETPMLFVNAMDFSWKEAEDEFFLVVKSDQASTLIYTNTFRGIGFDKAKITN